MSAQRARRVAGAALALALAGGCSNEPQPVPEALADFIGVWEHGRYGEGHSYVYLQISADGYFSHARFRRQGRSTTCVTVQPVAMAAFTRERIELSLLGFAVMSYAIDVPPQRSGNRWLMRVDGYDVQRTDERAAGFPYLWECDEGTLSRAAADGL